MLLLLFVFMIVGQTARPAPGVVLSRTEDLPLEQLPSPILIVEGDGGWLLARVTDDGRGPGANPPRGLGQAGMRDRATALNGRYQPPRREAGRTVTEFRLPCPDLSAQGPP